MRFKSVKQLLSFIKGVYRGRVAYRFLGEDKELVRITYGQFVNDVELRLVKINDEIGDISQLHVGVNLPNGYEYLVNLFAVMLGNGIAIAMNCKESQEMIKSEMAITDMDYIIDEVGIHKLHPLKSPQERDIDWNGDRPILMLFTSGTTGKQKAVMYSLEYLCTPAWNYGINFYRASVKYRLKGYDLHMSTPSRSGSTIYIMIPLFHIGAVATTVGGLLFGQTVDICNDIKYMYKELDCLQSGICVTVPNVLKAWARDFEKGKNRCPSLKLIGSGAAAVDSKTLKIFEKHGRYISQAYGMTELGAITHFNCDTLNYGLMSSVGRKFAGYKTKIVDGEILIKPAKKFLGYYNMPEETALIYKDGWIHTGDIGYISKKGRLYITGRLKNVIILSSGENVNPEELEDLLSNCKYIEDVVVKGENDHIVAYIYSRNHHEEIQDYINDMNRGLPICKRVTGVEFLATPMEKTSLGKAKRL